MSIVNRIFPLYLTTFFDCITEGSGKPEKKFVTRQEIYRYRNQVDIRLNQSEEIENEIIDYIIQNLFIENAKTETHHLIPKIKIHFLEFKKELNLFIQNLEENNNIDGFTNKKIDYFLIHRFVIPYIVFNYSDILKLIITEFGSTDIKQFTIDVKDRLFFKSFIDRLKKVPTFNKNKNIFDWEESLGQSGKTIQRYTQKAGKHNPTMKTISNMKESLSAEVKSNGDSLSQDLLVIEKFNLLWIRTIISMIRRAEEYFGEGNENEVFNHCFQLLICAQTAQDIRARMKKEDFKLGLTMSGIFFQDYGHLINFLTEKDAIKIPILKIQYSENKPLFQKHDIFELLNSV